MKATLINKVVDFLVLYMLIGVSGIPYFEWHKEFVIIGTILAGAVFFTRGHTVHVSIIYALILCYFIELFQAYLFNNLVISSMVKTFCKLLQAYFTVHVLGFRFFSVFVNFMYASCLLSLPFFIGGYLPGFTDFMLTDVCKYFGPAFPITESIDLYVRPDNIIIYTFNPNVIYDDLRNSGPFWEPGGFAVFINVALSINIALEKKLISVKNLVMTIVLITTFSTAGYLSLLCLVVGYVTTNLSVGYNVIILSVMLFVVPYLYTNLEFMEKKITSNLVSYNSDTTSRFGSAYFDLLDFLKNPIIGYGRRVENLFGNVAYDIKMHRNVGITSLLVHYGIIVFVLYFFYTIQFFLKYFQSIKQSFWYSFFALLSLLVNYSSQKICELPFFISLVFWGAMLYHRQPSVRLLPEMNIVDPKLR